MSATTLLFAWRGLTSDQQPQNGLVAAINTEYARVALHRQGISVLRLQRYYGRWKPAETVILTQQLVGLLSTGVPLAQALGIMARGALKKPLVHWVLQQLLVQVQSGTSLSRALGSVQQALPSAFDNLYLQLIEVAETSATLVPMLDRLAKGLEYKQQLQNQLRTASIYPLTVMMIGMLLLGVFMVVIVPVFAQLYAGKSLPWLTQIILTSSTWFIDFGWAILLSSAGVLLLLWFLLRQSPLWQIRWQKACLQIWILGPLLKKNLQAQLLQTLAMLLQAGLPLQTSLNLVASSTSNHLYKEQILAASRRIGLGHPLAKSLSPRWFGEDLQQMVAIGEESATLETILDRISRLYTTEVQEMQKRLGKLAEPILIVFLGIVIGILILALYLPVFEMGQVL